jgi:hypothetical protein
MLNFMALYWPPPRLKKKEGYRGILGSQFATLGAGQFSNIY